MWTAPGQPWHQRAGNPPQDLAALSRNTSANTRRGGFANTGTQLDWPSEIPHRDLPAHRGSCHTAQLIPPGQPAAGNPWAQRLGWHHSPHCGAHTWPWVAHLALQGSGWWLCPFTMLYLKTCLAVTLKKMLSHRLNKHLHTSLDDTVQSLPVLSFLRYWDVISSQCCL